MGSSCASDEAVHYVPPRNGFAVGSASVRSVGFGPVGWATQRTHPFGVGSTLGVRGWVAPLGQPLRAGPWALALALGLGYGLNNLGLGGLGAKGKAHALGHGP